MKTQNETCAAESTGKFNQVEEMAKEIQYLKDRIKDQQEELLTLYRRIYSYDGSTRPY